MLLGEQQPDGQWQWYIRDPQTDAPLFTLVNGETYYYELDWRNMPVRLWDPKGKRVWQANADAWGKCQPEGEVHQPIRLPGQFADELTGLYNNRFRDYDPKTGRYLTPDPLGITGGLNSYRYTPNPIDYVDPLGLNTCSASSPGPEEAENGEMAPVPEDSPALQNVEVAGAAVAVARAPVPAPAPTSPGVTRIAASTAANDAVYASQRSWLARALPIASTAAAFVGGMLYSPSLGGGLEEITATDGTVYSKHGDERIWNASGADGAQWQTADPQEDMEYRTWLANGGDGSFEDWVSEGKPSEVVLGSASSSGSRKARYLPGFTERDIAAIPRGSRPPADQYLEADYISEHLKVFNEKGGGFLFSPEDIANPKYGSFNPNKFIMAQPDLDTVVSQFQKSGDVSVLESALGYEPGSLVGKEVYMLHVDNPNVVMPSGNEGGANELWRPGGLTHPGGKREAVLNNQPISHGNDISNLSSKYDLVKIQ